jgi:diguanylate cyclase (GGDEF)-like protein
VLVPDSVTKSCGKTRAALAAGLLSAARLFRPMAVPPEIASRLNREQADVLAYLLWVMAIVGINSVALLGTDIAFSGRGATPVFPFILIGAIACGYGALFLRSRRWLLARNAGLQSPSAFFRHIGALLFVLGVLWGLLFILMMGIATPAQRSLLYAIIVACMSTAALVAPMKISFVFWTPISIGGLTALLVNADAYDPYAVICLIGYTALTGFCIVYLNRKLTERGVNAIQVEQNAEVIKLLLRDFEESASDWLWETNAALDLQRISPRLAQVARKPAAALTGKFPQTLLGDAARLDQRAGTPVTKLNRYIAERAAFRDLVLPVLVGGEERIWSLTGKPIYDKSGQFAGYHGVGSDITSVRRSQEQIAFLARHDSLTRLPNRVLFNEVLQQACAKCEQETVALLCLDLDDFKLVNDTLGHATGDAVLVAVGERIRSCIRDGDTAARLGGDEFAIILAGADAAEAAGVARRLVERISRPYHFDGRLVEIGISIGIAQGPQDSKLPGGLQKSADLALYRAKADGRGVWRFYDPEMDERFQERRSLQSDLRQALIRDEFALDFQPIIDLATDRVIAAEALLRWRHPERGLLQPAEFISLAEEAGLIAPMGAWVLRKACMIASTWPEHVRVAVNLSPVQFRDTGLVDTIDQVLTESGLKPSRLELEITETTVLETNTHTIGILWQLHRRGIRIALDDFGTGYSSLSNLRRFPFHKIKIDQSFIRDLGHAKDDSSIILALIGLADSMNMTVTAEGVETSEQAALLASYGCAEAQGFFFCRPIPADDMCDVIAAAYGTMTTEYPKAAQ